MFYYFVHRSLTFILNILSEFSILPRVRIAKKNVGIFIQNNFYRKWGWFTMRNYAGTCKDICS